MTGNESFLKSCNHFMHLTVDVCRHLELRVKLWTWYCVFVNWVWIFCS